VIVDRLPFFSFQPTEENAMSIIKRSTTAIEAISHVRQTMSEGQLNVADRMARVNSRHLVTFRDEALALRLNRLKRSLVAHYSGDEKQHRMLFIIGESHSGKSSLIEHAIASDLAFAPFVTSEGINALPMLFMQYPSPGTLRNMASDGLEALGYPVKATLSESRIWPLFREQLKRRQVLFLIIDEAQHAIKSNNNDWEIQKVRDTFKHLVQMPDWPLRLILCGVSPLESVRDGDKQIASRSTVLNLGPLDKENHAAHVRKYIEKIVVEHAEMELADFIGGDFPKRLIHACDGCFGSIVQLVRMAVETAMVANATKVEKDHFTTAYAFISGCSPTSNIFTLDDWASLDAGAAKVIEDKQDVQTDEKPKAIRAGERRK
jgi:type II secretory pathway predicted ATPase ExeA